MNIANTRKFISQLRRLDPRKFFMPWWEIHSEEDTKHVGSTARADALHTLQECGTLACGAGWCRLLNSSDPPHDDGSGAYAFARDFLGLTELEAANLFCGFSFYKLLSEVTLDDFIAELERMVEVAETKGE